MKKIVAGVSLALSVVAVHAVTLTGMGYQVTNTAGADPVIVGNKVVWTNGGPGVVLTTTPTQGSANLGFGASAPVFTFAALSGYQLDGFDITYSILFDSDSYLVTGNESGANFGGVLPGELFEGSMDFTTSFGNALSLVAIGPTHVGARSTGHITGSTLPASATDFAMSVLGLSQFCPTAGGCPPLGYSQLITSLTLQSITIKPLVSTVSAIPEPSTYALLLAGLGAVGMIARRRFGFKHSLDAFQA
jgi:hypothetical protein